MAEQTGFEPRLTESESSPRGGGSSFRCSVVVCFSRARCFSSGNSPPSIARPRKAINQLLILDKLSNRSHVHSMGFPRQGCSHEQSARPCGTGSATLRGRAFAATWCEAAGGGAAAQSEPHVGLALGAGAGERAQSVAQDTAHRATAGADRRQEEAIGRRARSRRLGARICHRSVDSGAGRQAHREAQWQAVFAIGRVAAAQGTELLLPAAERSRQEAR